MTRPGLHAIEADHVFDGSVVRERTAVIIEGMRIVDLVPLADLPRNIATRKLPEGTWLAPGFIDLQVNGGGDVLFNDDPSVESIRTIAAAHRKFGTTALLPTLISDSMEKMRSALEAADAAFDSEAGVLGVHLEGPYLSSEKPGVHDPRQIRRPRARDVDRAVQGRAPRHLGAGGRAARLHRATRHGRRSRRARSLHGVLSADPSCND